MMFLKNPFPQPELNLSLELFLRMLNDQFGERLISVVLYGSVIFNDLAPGYGDLDFLAVVDDDLTEEECKTLALIRNPLRSGDFGVLCHMIEGAFLPRKMLNPNVSGNAFWWGTSGERPWILNQLGWLVLHVIRERGIVIYNQDIREEIPKVQNDDLLQDIRMFCMTLREQGRGGGLHSIDWLLTTARELLFLKEGKLSSKSEAADWAFMNAKGAWKEYLPQAKRLRKNPTLADSPDVKQWLERLTEPIRQAREELEEAVSQHNLLIQ